VKLSRRTFARHLAAVASASAIVGAPRLASAAGDLTVTASVGATETRVGDAVQVSFAVRQVGSEREFRWIWPKDLEGNFEVVSQRPGRASSYGRGATVVENTMTVVLRPVSEGDFDLGFSIEIGGGTVASNKPVLKVLPAQPGVDAADDGGPTRANGDLFAWANTDKTVAYVGEQVTYRLDLYERRQFINVQLRKPPKFSDFFSEDLPIGETEKKLVGGVPHRMRPVVRRALFPQRTGILKIGAAELSNGFRRPMESPALAIEVIPLPGEGQPKNFSPNNVGLYEIETAVDRTKVDPAEPFTLTVTIRGTGNIKFIDPGTWPTIDGVRRYEPKIDTRMGVGEAVHGERKYEFLMIPQGKGPITIPAHTFAFFDPDVAGYAESRSEPIVVEVVGGSDDAAQPLEAAQEEVESDESQLAKVIEGDALPVHVPRTRWLTTTRWVYGMLAVPALAVGGIAGAALLRRFGPDDRARSRARDKMRRQLRISAAEEAVASGEGFHATVSNLLHELAVRRGGADGVGLPRPELLRLIEARGVESDDLKALRELLDTCDAARFAAQTGSSEDRRALLDRALTLVRKSSLSKEGP